MTGARAVVPKGLASYVAGWRMSPGRAAGGFVVLTAMTGTVDGRVDPDPEAQIEEAFAKVDAGLAEAGLDRGAVVEVRVIARLEAA